MKDYLELTKPRITVLIALCTAAGYSFGSHGGLQVAALLNALLGTALMASGTAALNQAAEADSDAMMNRTRNRPVPAGRLSVRRAAAFGVVISTLGFIDLWIGANPLAALLGLFTLVTYLCFYTPLKRLSPICTTVGAIPGAMPPMIGYAAASGKLDLAAMILFLILFVWQFPHFYAIAWMYREDYARGGIRMLPVVEPDGRSTARRVVAFCIVLLAVTAVPAALKMSGSLYLIAALASGLWLLYSGVRFGIDKTRVRARQVLLASILYLPVVFVTIAFDRS
jgi:heme o synthase